MIMDNDSRTHTDYAFPFEGVNALSSSLSKRSLGEAFCFGGNMKIISLTQGKYALVDDEDFSKVSQYKWHYSQKGYTGYAFTLIKKPTGQRTTLSMHQLIMDTPKGLEVDHINGVGTDNRRLNIRICNRHEQMQNQKGQRGKTSQYKGVSWDERNKKWRAQIKKKGKRYNIGRYDNEQNAMEAYQVKAKELFGEFAYKPN